MKYLKMDYMHHSIKTRMCDVVVYEANGNIGLKTVKIIEFLSLFHRQHYTNLDETFST
jgi:hypothetical protein